MLIVARHINFEYDVLFLADILPFYVGVDFGYDESNSNGRTPGGAGFILDYTQSQCEN